AADAHLQPGDGCAAGHLLTAGCRGNLGVAAADLEVSHRAGWSVDEPSHASSDIDQAHPLQLVDLCGSEPADVIGGALLLDGERPAGHMGAVNDAQVLQGNTLAVGVRQPQLP